MIFRLLLILMLPLCAWSQSDELERRVMRKHANGKDYVVLYFDKETAELLKEEVYYNNGKLQWAGDYKRNLENGTWKFYHENGKLKTEETYLNGREHGTTKEYDETGKKIKETYWKHGKLIKEVTFD
ncbi:MAG: toxin-antitoxin system YwqK family antitoxin [Flavobacteriales bacterium]